MDTRLPQIASLDEKTVQQAEQHASDYARPTTRQRRPTVRLNRFQVHPLVWSTALELAAGEPKRIKVVSETEVLVVNNP